MFDRFPVRAANSIRSLISSLARAPCNQFRINFPADGKIQARKVVTRSRERYTGKYPSWKMGDMLQWESANEKIVYRILDADPCVHAIFAQPFQVEFVDGRQWVRHYPDVLVGFFDGPEVWEVKDHSERDSTDLKRRTAILCRLFSPYGVRYRTVFVDKRSLRGVYAYAKSVLRPGRRTINPLDRERARRHFTCTPTVSWSDATSGCIGPDSKRIIARLLLEGVLSASERSRALAPETLISAQPETRPLMPQWRG